MKKLLFAVLLTASLATTAFAKENNKVNVRISNNFQTQFNEAKNVDWSIKNNFARASFDMNGERMEAFYNLNGEIIGTSKNILVSQLPVRTQKDLAKKYNDYTISAVIHFDGQDENAYYISAENKKESIVLRSEGGIASLFKRDKKK